MSIAISPRAAARKVAIECGDERVTYAQVAERVNRFGAALRRLGVQPEQRCALMLLDSPAFAYSFFGAIKVGAVPVPINTMWRARDYQYALADSGARVARHQPRAARRVRRRSIARVCRDSST